ncbi:MAG: ATP-binding protein [Gemmatimonadota bacterium]
MSIRRRLTIGYAAALAITIVGFGVILYLNRRSASFADLDNRLELESRLSERYLADSYRVLGELVITIENDTTPSLGANITPYFDSFRDDYLILLGKDGRVLYLSNPVAALSFASIDQLTRLAAGASKRELGTTTIDPAGGLVRYLVMPITGSDPKLGNILVAASTSSNAIAPQALLRSMLVIAPITFIASILLGYWLAGSSLKPLEKMVDELTEITDGRSLHRRLPVDARANDEPARLAQAANGMFERLEQSFAAQQRFVADASHELKTPLMVLRAGVERVLVNPNTPPESLQPLDESLEEINRMTELVENLLTLARADEGLSPLAVEECDVAELVNEAAETAGMLAELAGIEVRTQVPPGPVLLNVDRNRVRQLLLNLVTNAVKYTPRGGQVGLGLADQGSAVEFVVRDTGIGIAAGDLPHIFDRFWRADPVRSRESDRPGTGLGLAITKWIAEAHGGSISAQSRPGRGTIFTVSLPRQQQPAVVS